MFSRPRLSSLSRSAMTLLAASALLVSQSGCDRIKAKIKRLAQGEKPAAATKAKAEGDAQKLTPEEEAKVKALEDPKMFDPSAPAPAAIPVTEVPAPEPAEPAEPETPVVEINKSAQVAILGYHDFKERGGTPQLINTAKFRGHLQAIKDAKIPVIPMSDFLAWKRGEKDIPEECIVITMDDGWVGVYQIAYPMLKEFGFPFTIYLYNKYVNTGGRAMTWAQIKEMMAYGCEVGSHTVSHDYLTNVRYSKAKVQTEEAYQLRLLTELKDSKDFLERNLGIKVTSIAYPYGAHSPQVEETALQVGYEAGFTVSPQKVSWDMPNGKLSRYIVHGEEDTVFKMATSFRGKGEIGNSKTIANDAKDPEGNALVTFTPANGATITERTPTIEANLIRLGQIVPESLKMRITGMGIVPCIFDPKTFIVRYDLPMKLRREDCSVTLSFKRDLTAQEEYITWHFKVNLAAAYLPPVPPVPPTPVVPMTDATQPVAAPPAAVAPAAAPAEVKS